MGAVAILGGTFDPVHNTHLAMARAALTSLAPCRILWVPTGSPGYRNAPVAAAVHRLAMLRLAISGEPQYSIDERELAPGASGYTYDTLAALRAELGAQATLILLMGADQHAALQSWHRWQEIPRLARIAVFARPGYAAPDGVDTVPMPPSDVSASAIRAKITAGEDVAALLPPAVLHYIEDNNLYR